MRMSAIAGRVRPESGSACLGINRAPYLVYLSFQICLIALSPPPPLQEENSRDPSPPDSVFYNQVLSRTSRAVVLFIFLFTCRIPLRSRDVYLSRDSSPWTVNYVNYMRHENWMNSCGRHELGIRKPTSQGIARDNRVSIIRCPV